MSILIKGMEIPTSCGECKAFVCYKQWAGDRGDCFCGITKSDCKAGAQNADCPLVPVPPHGRLIESVELYGKAEDIKTKALSACDKPQSWQFGAFWTIEQIEAALANAPTIIPASEEGER